MATRGELEARIRSNFPAWAWLLDEPEVGPLLLEAVDPNSEIDSATLQARLMGTGWWQSHSQAVRTWDALVATDPSTAFQQVADTADMIRRRARVLGVSISDAKVNELATTARRFGWSPEIAAVRIDKTLITEGDREAGGELDATFTRVKQLARRQMVPLSDATARSLADAVVAGEQSWDGIAAQLATQAKALYPHLAAQIDQGITLTEIFEPYRQVAAQTLELHPDSIDPMTDPRFAVALSGEGPGDLMSLSAWQRTLRTDRAFGWHKTDQAHEQAFALADTLLRKMGAIR